MENRRVSDSITTMTELVLPNHTNTIGNLLGGQLMHWIDVCAGICAFRHSKSVCVTASVDSIDFHHPIKLGQIVTLKAEITRAFNTSMEIKVEVYADSFKESLRIPSNSAFLTFVSVDNEGKPHKVPQILPETPEERIRFNDALIRRENRLKTRQNT